MQQWIILRFSIGILRATRTTLHYDRITASYADSACRDASMWSILRQSDIFTDELPQADCIVIGAPMYNFSVPASLKAYIDLVARPGVHFASVVNSLDYLDC